MTPLPNPDLNPEEVDQIIKDHAKPLPDDRKTALLKKLRGERERFEKSKAEGLPSKEDRSLDR